VGADSTRPDTAGDLTRAQIRGSSLLLAGQAFALVANLAVQVLLVRYLSKSSYGVFAYALSIVTLGEAIASFGLRRGVGRFLPIYEERGELDKVAGTLVFAIATVLSMGLAFVLVVIGLGGVISDSFSGEPAATAVITAILVLAPIQAVANLLDGMFAVFTRPRAILLRKFVYTPVMRLIMVVMLSLAGAGVVPFAVGYTVIGGAGTVVYGAMLITTLRERRLWERLRRGRMTFPIRELLSFTVPLLTNDLAFAFVNAAGAVMLGLLAGAQDVAELRAVVPVAMTMSYVLSSFGLLFVPLASRLFARGDTEELNRLYWQTAGWTTVLSYPIFIVSVGLAEPLTLLLFGDRYASSASLLQVLAVGRFITAAAGPNSVLLGVYRRVGFLVATNLVAMVTSLGLNLLLIPPFGAMGAAIAATATLAVFNAIWQVGLARRTDIHGLHPGYVSVYVTIVVATAAFFAIQLIASPPLVGSAALAALVSLAVLVVTRRRLALAETFPELARLPVVRLLAGPGGARARRPT
jgi:O-antigen/teichoic acid export membrane protein